MDLIPGLGRSPGEWNSNPLQLFLPGEFHGQRSLAGYSPWSHKRVGHILATKHNTRTQCCSLGGHIADPGERTRVQVIISDEIPGGTSEGGRQVKWREGHEETSKRGSSLRAMGHNHAGTFGGSVWGGMTGMFTMDKQSSLSILTGLPTGTVGVTEL